GGARRGHRLAAGLRRPGGAPYRPRRHRHPSWCRRARVRCAAVGSAAADCGRRRLRGGGVTEVTVDAPAERAPSPTRLSGRAVLRSLRELALLPAIAVLFVIGIVSSPAFFTTANLSNTAQASAALGMVVVAETLILLTGSFDLSLQSIYGLAPMVGAWLIVSTDGHGLGTDWPAWAGILVCFAIGAAVG